MLDELFGAEAFVNELIWRYGKMANATRRFSHAHDQLIVYSRGPDYAFNPQSGGVSEYRNRYERWVRDDNNDLLHPQRDQLVGRFPDVAVAEGSRARGVATGARRASA